MSYFDYNRSLWKIQVCGAHLLFSVVYWLSVWNQTVWLYDFLA